MKREKNMKRKVNEGLTKITQMFKKRETLQQAEKRKFMGGVILGRHRCNVTYIGSL